MLSNLTPLSGDKAIQILQKDGDFDQLKEFCLAMSECVKNLENAPSRGGSGSGIRVQYTTGDSSFTTRDFNPNNRTLFPDLP